MAWKPLQPAVTIRNPERIEAIIAEAKRQGSIGDETELRKRIDDDLSDPVWKNLDYQVHVKIVGEGTADDGSAFKMVHLSIRRLDRRPVRDWRDLQRIKNQLLGPECEAVELFPAESRLVDEANQYHLWGFDNPRVRFDVGFTFGRSVMAPSSDPATGTAQRPIG